jgi:acetyl esterase/lipase
MTWSWLFLAVSLVGALFTFNAYLPRPAHGRLLAIPSFFAGWLTSELVAHHFVWQLAATAFFVWMGALDAWPGWLGLGVTVASWAALLAMVPVARRSEHVVEAALGEGLGLSYRADTMNLGLREPSRDHRPLVNPFRFHHPDVRVERDLVYAPGFGKRHLLDVYAPRDGATGAPVLLQIHGGGWTVGNKDQQALPLMNQLAARGWVCVAANYRLSPKATFPDHIVDAKLALAWIREHAAEYGGDARFVAVTGGSAGGHLSSLLALTPNDPEYQPGFEMVDTRVQACVPFYGVYDWCDELGIDPHDTRKKFFAKIVLKKRFADDPDAYRRASPVARVNPDASPFFVLHGAHDSLVPVEQARHFVSRLRAVSKAPVCYAELPHAQHAFEIFHSHRTAHVVRAVDRFLAWTWGRWRMAAERRDA